MIFDKGFRILLTTGYDKHIQLIKINPEFLDDDKVGALLGHSGLVTAIQVRIPKLTPLIVHRGHSLRCLGRRPLLHQALGHPVHEMFANIQLGAKYRSRSVHFHPHKQHDLLGFLENHHAAAREIVNEWGMEGFYTSCSDALANKIGIN